MAMTDPMIAELDQEAQTTRRVLDRIPEDHLGWRPHATSMTLGQLGLHVAATPGVIAELLALDEVEPPHFGDNPRPATKAQILDAFELGTAKARNTLAEMDDSTAMKTWRIVKDGRELMALPRIGIARAIMLNHWYHHRGQLCVYLRMLGVPVPAVYGASLDENPFEA